jgi:tRNA (uracil-5-)-methyltransferase
MPLSAVQPANYHDLLLEKVNSVRQGMSPFFAPAPTVYPSQPTGFRMRAEFRIWHEADDLNYVMFRREDPKTPVVITNFPIADKYIQDLMPVLRQMLKANNKLRHKLFQVEFLASLTGEVVITLVYHRKLNEVWECAAHQLVNELRSVALTVSIIGRSRKQKLVIGQDFVHEALCVHGEQYRYRQYEQSFSQPNGLVNVDMIEWACRQAESLQGDLLELYCGNGNFTLPLSRYFENVIATEMSKPSIRAARGNLMENSIQNVQLLRMSAEEVTQAMNAERVFRRLGELPKPLDQYDLNTLFVDPPRVGIDEHTTAMASRFRTIIYISCNPASLALNMRALHKTHYIAEFALFDQFPYTEHIECGLLLQRR